MARFVTTNLEVNDRAIGELLDKISALDRSPALIAAAKAAGELVVADAKPRIRAGGYDGDKPGKPSLRSSIRTVVREYRGAVVVFTGPKWPEGAHGHLVEFGHLQTLKDGTVIQVPPRPWLRPAVEATLSAQKSVILDGLQKAVQ
jgi:hypothetical protein